MSGLIAGLFRPEDFSALSKELTRKLEGRGASALVPMETLAQVALALWAAGEALRDSRTAPTPGSEWNERGEE